MDLFKVSSLIRINILSILILSLFVMFFSFETFAVEKKTLKIGYFANITHAQAVIGVGEGKFQKAIGEDYNLKSIVFNAGPTAVEALISGNVDIIYVGPNPVFNGWIKFKKGIHVISGASNGGVRLIVSEKSNIKQNSDFIGKRLATPQFGNTQDISARKWLSKNGMKPTTLGGQVNLIPIKNADQLLLFMIGELDASWAIEPWATRLIIEAKGKEFLNEKSLWKDGVFPTTLVVTSKKFLNENPDVVKKFIAEHVAITKWIQKNPEEARVTFKSNFDKITKNKMSKVTIDEAFKNVDFVYSVNEEALTKAIDDAFELGFLGKQKISLSGLINSDILNEAEKLAEKNCLNFKKDSKIICDNSNGRIWGEK